MTKMTPDKFKIYKDDECELSRWLNREFPNEPVFVYRQNEWMTHGVGIWINKGLKIAHELRVIPALNQLSVEDKDVITRLLRRGFIGDQKAVGRFVKDADYCYRQGRAADDAEIRGFYKFIFKHLKSNAAKSNPLLRALAGVT